MTHILVSVDSQCISLRAQYFFLESKSGICMLYCVVKLNQFSGTLRIEKGCTLASYDEAIYEMPLSKVCTTNTRVLLAVTSALI